MSTASRAPSRALTDRTDCPEPAPVAPRSDRLSRLTAVEEAPRRARHHAKARTGKTRARIGR
jgi:hypothetical protein